MQRRWKEYDLKKFEILLIDGALFAIICKIKNVPCAQHILFVIKTWDTCRLPHIVSYRLGMLSHAAKQRTFGYSCHPTYLNKVNLACDIQYIVKIY